MRIFGLKSFHGFGERSADHRSPTKSDNLSSLGVTLFDSSNARTIRQNLFQEWQKMLASTNSGRFLARGHVESNVGHNRQ
jgi:hypothetical protein